MLNDRIAIVTGAGKGIGRHAARTLAQAGATVVVSDLEAPDGVAKELEGLGAKALAVRADVRDEGQVRAMVDKALEEYGRIDIVVNNAGVVPHFAWGIPRWDRIRDMKEEFWNRVLDTNLGGTFRCTKAVLPHMEEQGSGHVINLYGGGSGPGGCPYVVSKDAIKTFTRMVGEEEREYGVCVVAISPGKPIVTEGAPAEALQRLPGPETLEDVFVRAAEVGMEMAGKTVALEGGKLVVVP